MQNVTAWRKSTRSGGGGSSNCVELRRSWRKSNRSNSAGTNECVEIAPCEEAGFHVRDSKLGDGSPMFDLSEQDFSALIRTL
ncbi:DUF397 domain-containing protein [Glycomyces artemisiae]|uniref:Uncharacterized protein DUF397 n=1 Tax=Glycomyces artemisiae TaxID=1076443 RepID=A0A2T0UNV6_9ACTN|nr:DUF397 domain-containing protein [Glycomyces artemisiae]PRY59584.1 uncharacterized protein DUF397 [Glycomyces artemisiae]